MSVNVSDFLIQRLNEWGVRRIYGFPGDGINGIIGAIGRAGEKVDYVQVRHEEMSAFMAARYAEMLGLTGIRVDQAEQIGPAWDEALAAKRPVVIEAVTDPEVPPLPPHITFKQAMNFSKSLLYDSARKGMIRGAMKDMVESVLPHQS